MSSLSSALGGGPGGAARPLHALHCVRAGASKRKTRNEARAHQSRGCVLLEGQIRGGAGGETVVTCQAPLELGRARRLLDRHCCPHWASSPLAPPHRIAPVHLTLSCPPFPVPKGGRPAAPCFPLAPCLHPAAAQERKGDRRKETRQKWVWLRQGGLIKANTDRNAGSSSKNIISDTHMWAHPHTHTHASSPILSPGIFYSGVRSSGLEPVAQSPG